MEKVPVIALSVVLTLGSGGCSWLFVQPLAPNYRSGDPVNCTSNVAAPVIDSVFTVLDTVELATVAGNSNVQNRGAVLTGATLGIILWGSSAIYGYRHTSECSEAQSDSDSQPSYRRRSPTTTSWQTPPRQRLAPPVPAAPPAPAHDQADEPSVTAPSQPPAPQQRDDDGPG